MLWRIKIIFKGLFLVFLALIEEICILFRVYQIPAWLYEQSLKIWSAKRARLLLLARLGFVYERANQTEKARKCYEEVCKLGTDGHHYISLGFIYEKQNKISLAIESYERFLQVDTRSSLAFRDEIQSKIKRLKREK